MSWQQVFDADRVSDVSVGGQHIDPFFHEFKAIPMRESRTNNDIKVRKTSKGKSVQMWILCRYLDHKFTDEDIIKEMEKWAVLADDNDVKTRYQAVVEALGFDGAIVDQLGPDGLYWTKLRAAAKSNVKIIHKDSLNEVFQDDMIYQIVGEMFAISNVPQTMWSNDIHQFAFGHN